jgi:hypothetical protein
MTRAVRAACLLSLSIGLLFLFVRAPHPWGWNGFDHYHEFALALASGQPFPTMEVPWGYAYFLAAFYRLFGDRPWVPLLVQVSLNALTPMLLFAIARRWTDRGTAAIAALLLGALSFNTVYASTQSSDAVCTVLFLTAILVFITGLERDEPGWFGLAGLIAGVMSQFRPNLILIPVVLAAYMIWRQPVRVVFKRATILLMTAAVPLIPWIGRNYNLTGTLLPTSVHGGAQLWYGTLQTGPYLDSRGYNPRSVFESPAFEYTSLDHVPIRVSAGVTQCAAQDRHAPPVLLYWTDFDPTRHRLTPAEQTPGGRLVFALPPPPESPATYYYYFAMPWLAEDGTTQVVETPPGGAATPMVYFVSQDHLGDLDRYNDLLDIFDVIRLVRHEAWGEPLPAADSLRKAGVVDVRTAADRLLNVAGGAGPEAPIAPIADVRVEHDETEARITIGGTSRIVIPRAWHEKLTDVAFVGAPAEVLMRAHASIAALIRPAPTAPEFGDTTLCARIEEVRVNDVFYREQPQAMRRYSALAFDNIRREPLAFLEASLYRTYRVFVVVGSADKWTNQQFSGAAAVYAAATAASLTFLGLFIAGVVILWRRGSDILLPLLLILYVPATIAPLLTNMRYSVTVQPLMFVFVASALSSLATRLRKAAAPSAEPGHAETRTAPRL